MINLRARLNLSGYKVLKIASFTLNYAQSWANFCSFRFALGQGLGHFCLPFIDPERGLRNNQETKKHQHWMQMMMSEDQTQSEEWTMKERVQEQNWKLLEVNCRHRTFFFSTQTVISSSL